MNIYRSENTKFYDLLSRYAHDFSRIGVEMTNAQREIIRLRDELQISMAEAKSLEDARKKLSNAIQIANELVDELNKLNATAKSITDVIVNTTTQLGQVIGAQKTVEFKEAMKEIEKREKKVEGAKEEKPKAGVVKKSEEK